jgi:hypothetical protein
VTAADALPQPQAISGVVWIDAVERTLTVRLPDQAGGYERMLWTQAWQQLRRAQEAGWPDGRAPWVFADLPGARQVVHGQPGEGGTLRFTFPPKTPGFAELISKPGVIAIVTVDRGSQRFLSCKFLNRPGLRDAVVGVRQ